MQNNLTLGSLFDGSGGFPLGGLLSGITPLWASEVEPFPIRVTTKRLPQMKHMGDISTINGGEIEPVDIITFGSPCQDMSVAGKRNGLDGSRSSLFYEAIRIVKEMRCATNGQYPRFIVWENVPGAFSSNKGEDFKAVLESICSVKEDTISVPMPKKWTGAGHLVGDGFDIAWRTVDAQYWGVPQRRRRIYLVADFASGCAGKILFESEGLSGYSSKSRCSWEGAVATTKGSSDETSTVNLGDQGNVHPAFVFENHSQDARYTGPLDVAQTVLSTFGTGGNNQPFVIEVPQAFGICAKASNSMQSNNPHSGFYKADTARTLDANGGNPNCNQGGIAVVALQGSMIGRKDKNGPNGDGVNENTCYTLNTVDRHGVVYAIDRETINCGKNFYRNLGISADGVNATLKASGPDAVAVPSYSMTTGSFMQINTEKAATLAARDYKDPPLVNDVDGDLEYIVRRLTPIECARLQGFPDWWCDDLGIKVPSEEELDFWADVFETHRKIVGTSIKPKTRKQIFKWLQNPNSDSAEYKMWGNGVALPNVCFVLSGIVYYTQNTGE
ncbi:hypothetical protein TPDSL_03360 [Terrisporobacter petrolearius]|uniref:DNA cytosine methyltransferase n=1 Tax=Terrisporobacter petrolearius TaxID=1460447 RepID=UPI003365B5E4